MRASRAVFCRRHIMIYFSPLLQCVVKKSSYMCTEVCCDAQSLYTLKDMRAHAHKLLFPLFHMLSAPHWPQVELGSLTAHRIILLRRRDLLRCSNEMSAWLTNTHTVANIYMWSNYPAFLYSWPCRGHCVRNLKLSSVRNSFSSVS